MISKVTRNFQVTIPYEIRKVLGIKEGDYIEFAIENGKVMIKPVRKVWSTIRLGREVTVEEIEEIASKAFKDDSS
ncbi:AbrB/MazE/SpoVT family DNA-binding domain-containing protein [Saccharolobus solfataricus]|uniref:AbrB/MazE/SpoVT family DNA-binding domain-containing protein n=2 Tax=Saccharolobus solfataricus TaxID=2287 RepID=A0A157T1M9_SACSO|nr:AbrB/MazE/SpoVT family DNA-binding domain-containing protein [Saccharolobus solfataricus]QPG51216.1 AbrB/MazE/SpoVT family DNA-binding domain-containing protein [Saccharolobus solfataricus]SAI85159.1 antitoxin VapB [Saccharolobus solfataricus]